MKFHPAAVMVLGFMCLGLAAQGAERQSLSGHVPQIASNRTPTGRLPADQRLNLAIGLPLRNPEALTSLLQQIYDPTSPNYRHYLTPEEFAARFGPSEADYEAVAAFAEANGLNVTARHPNRLLLDVEGSVADIEKTLHVQMNTYAHPSEARTFYAPDSEPSLDLPVRVLHISGLDNASLPKPRLQATRLDQTRPAASPLAGSGPSGSYRGADFRAAYAPGVTLNGAGQKVGLLQFDGYTASDISYYEAQAGLPSVTLSNVLLDGFNGSPSGYGGEVEVSLDIEMAISMSPGLSAVIVYMAGPNGNWHDILNRMATDNAARQLSCSWYIPGGGIDTVADQIFQQMAAQGQSFFNASGDYDAYTGPIDFPGETPYLTQVGGTMLTTTGPGGTRVSEQAWNRNNGIGTGGGISTRYAIPVWQTGVNMTANLGSTTQRNTPDVALTAENVYVRADGVDYNVGGTSCAAPLWAGFCALINQQAATFGRPSPGLVNAAVYALGLGSGYGAAFNDITSGNNFSSSSPARFPAVTGYDLCTGWGTPNGQGMINALAIPDNLVVSPSAGFVSSGAAGGPFNPAALTCVLTNIGTNSLTWSLGNTSAWLTVSSAGGVLTGGATASVTVGLNQAASNLPPAQYTANVLISNVTSGYVYDLPFALLVHDALVITPTNGFNANGPVGGPFTITSLSYALSNSSSADLNWSLANTSLWLSASSASGGLLPAGLTAYVTVGLNTTASNLPPALYSGDVQFTNLTSGFVQDRQFTLQTGKLPVQNNGFENGNFLGWTLSGNTQGSTVTSNALYVHSGTYGAREGASSSLGYLGQTLNTVPGHLYLISAWLENPGGVVRNEFQVNWEGVTVLDQINVNATVWTNFQVEVAALTTNSVLQFGFQNRNSYFGFDDVTVFETSGATNPPAFATQPTNQTVTAGLTATFSATASGIAPFFYQWQFNGTNIPNATNTLLVLSPTTTNEAGLYSVVASNAFGATSSSNATLSVLIPVCVAPKAGMVGWWAGEGNAGDGVGTHNGTLEGGASFTNGEVGQAFSFNGNGQFVNVPASPDLNVGSQLTVEFWMRPDPTNSMTNFQGMVSSDNYIVGNLSSPVGINGLDFWITTDQGSGEIAIANGYAGAAVAAGQWHHVAATYDGSQMVLYIDGQPWGNPEPITGTIAPMSAGSFLALGSEDGRGNCPTCIGTRYFSGQMDEVSIYNRALSANEIHAIFAAGSAGKCPGMVPPSITRQPQGATVVVGGTASFSVAAGGSTPLSYQWQLNRTNIAGATNALLALSNIQFSNAGVYSLTITNPAGTTTSSNAILTVLTNAECYPPPAGLVSWWRAESNALDQIGGNNGTLSGNVVFTSGEVGKGFRFDGNGACVQLGNPASLQLQNFTIEAWIARSSATTASLNNGTQQGLVFAYDNSGYGLSVYDAGNLALSKVGISAVVSSVTITDTNWHHVAVTKSGTNVVFYVDGVGYPAAPYDPGFVFNTTVSIGGIGNTYSFYGLVDELSVYNRSLSAAEIAAIQAVGAAGKCVPAYPVILAQPTNQTVVAGATAAFGVTFTGQAPLSYQWQFNQTNLPGATNAALILTNVQVSSSGPYSLTITNFAGATTSSNAILTVLNAGCYPPPAGLVSWWRAEGNALDQAGGNTGTLSGNVTFGPAKVGQGFIFDGNGSYVQIGNPTNLQLQNFTIEAWIARRSTTIASFNGNGHGHIFTYDNSGYGLYLNGAGNLSLGKVGLQEVLSSVMITDTNLHHVAATKSGSNVVFYVDGVGYPAPAFDPGFVFNTSATIGGIANNYSFYGEVDELSFYNRGLSAAEIAAIHAVGAAGKCVPAYPIITSQPTNQTVVAGATAVFGVTVTGQSPLSYQWQFNQTKLTGATNALLTLTNVQGSNGGLYAVVVTNIAGSTASSNALLTVLGSQCDPPPTNLVSWWRAEGNAADTTGTNGGSLQGGATFTNGEVGQAFSFNGSGQYVKIPASPALNVGSQLTVEFWMRPDPANTMSSFQGMVSSDNYIVGNLSSPVGVNGVDFWVTTDQGSGEIAVANGYEGAAVSAGQWHHVAATYNGSQMVLYIDGRPWGNPEPLTGTILPISAAGFLALGSEDGRGNCPSCVGTRYFNGRMDEVSIYNRALSAGEIAAIFNASVAGKCTPPVPPVITQQPGGQNVVLGSNASFSVTASGTLPLSYQWRFNGINLNGASSSALGITNVQPTNAGNYSVVVSNVAGSVPSSNALLTIVYPPVITKQPSKQLVMPGCPATFTATVTGATPLGYQWYRNGSVLPGQTNTALNFASVQSFDFATYNLTASNAYGKATSSNAVLALDNAPNPGGTVVQRYSTGGIRVSVFNVLANDSDPDGDTLSIVGVVSNSVAGGTVSLSGNSIYYLPPTGNTNADSFNYTVSDGHCGGTATGTVQVQVRTDTNPAAQGGIEQSGNGSLRLFFDGIPGYAYRIQSTDSLVNPNWQDVVTLTADQFGTVVYVINTPTATPSRYYRSVWP